MSDSLEHKLAEFRDLVQKRLLEISSKPAPVSFYTPVRYTLESGGKRLRPVLVLLSTEAAGGRARQALDCAVAVELMHNFTLVHDDIMDHDSLRRGRPTVHVKWDEETAILAGDRLVALAFRELFRCLSPKLQEIGRVFSEGILEVCEGQALDKEFETRDSVSREEYFDMIGKKTARLFAVSCEMGALAADAGDQQVKALREFGWNLGLAFQIQDDLLDVVSSASVSGKPQGSDVRSRKKTFLFIHAVENSQGEKSRWLVDLYKRGNLSSEDVESVVRLFHESGAVAAAEAVTAELLTEAQRSLAALPPSEARSQLESLTNQLLGRRA
ncbi:MAG TPA: polyprenyl synthetase family protein [Bacteroidetes bacterium]|nr:polyprenyl synthetase family protein [Bacteroidota bacterium]